MMLQFLDGNILNQSGENNDFLSGHLRLRWKKDSRVKVSNHCGARNARGDHETVRICEISCKKYLKREKGMYIKMSIIENFFVKT